MKVSRQEQWMEFVRKNNIEFMRDMNEIFAFKEIIGAIETPIRLPLCVYLDCRIITNRAFRIFDRHTRRIKNIRLIDYLKEYGDGAHTPQGFIAFPIFLRQLLSFVSKHDGNVSVENLKIFVHMPCEDVVQVLLDH
jgi:hypothetical protein